MTNQPETDCPTPETHNWGCGCPTDVAAAIASCPGHEVDGPSPCRCPCEGCKHNCAAHQPAAVSAAVAPPTNHGLSLPHADALWDAVAIPGPRTPTYPEQHERVCRAVREILDDLLPAPAEETDEVDADTVANRAAQVITTMGAEIRELKHSRDRYRTAWLSARHRVALRRTAVWVANIRWAADHLDNSERLRDLTDDHMGDINAAANELRRVADETATETPHTCDNCEGVNPDTCINDPSRPPERCPSCGHPVDGHDPYEGCVGPHGVGGLGSGDCPCTGEQLITGVQP